MKLKEIIDKVESKKIESWVGWAQRRFHTYHIRIDPDLAVEYYRMDSCYKHTAKDNEVQDDSWLTDLIVVEDDLELPWIFLYEGYIPVKGVDFNNFDVLINNRFKRVNYLGIHEVATITYPTGRKFTGLLHYADIRNNRIYFVKDPRTLLKKLYTKECKFELVEKGSDLYKKIISKFIINPDKNEFIFPERNYYLSLENKKIKIGPGTVGKKLKFNSLSFEGYKKVTGIVTRYYETGSNEYSTITINKKDYYPEFIELIHEVK